MDSDEKKEIWDAIADLEDRVEKLSIAVHGDEDLNLGPVRRQVDELELTINRAKWFLAGLAAANAGTIAGGIAWVTSLVENLK